MPLTAIDMGCHYTEEQEVAIVQALEQCTAQIPRDHVLIRLNDLPFENWGIRGGHAACDVELGFETNL